MTNPSLESRAADENEKPLDPELLRVQARLRRLMLIAGLTLGLGIFAVFAAILYRIVTLDATSAPAAANPAALSLAALGLPSDGRLVSTSLDGNHLALTYETVNGTEIVVIDLRSGTVINRLTVGR
jgi:hypothetical protein